MPTPAEITLLLFVGAVILVVVWIALPFAVFGIKPLLQVLIDEQRRTNDLLEQVIKRRS
jgi:ABC-type spermidine/putrescine transport system permease subunit I